MDFSLYWFMFPTAIVVATTAMLSGIGGAALFMPIFLLLFPLLGPEYPLASPVAAIAVALLTNAFGFTSGFISYYRRRLIDFVQSRAFLGVAIPAAIFGALVSHLISPSLIKAAYGILTLGLAALLLRARSSVQEVIAPSAANREIIDNLGNQYIYQRIKPQRILTAIGALLTGALSTGVGEVVMPQLLKKGKIPAPVATATSVVVVIATVAAASLTHMVSLISQGGIDAVPWNLVCYTIPGVIIGGQIGPHLAGRVSADFMQTAVGLLFAMIGITMLIVVSREFI